MFRYYTKILTQTRWRSFKGSLVSHSLWEVPCWLVSENPRCSSHILLTAGEGSSMGERPRFNHSGTVTVTRQWHHPQAKHAGPTLQALGTDWRGGRRLPGKLPRAWRPASTRRHCSGGSSVTPALPSPMAAVVKDPFLEERREFTDGVLREHQPHFVDVQGGRGRLEHHTEKVPEVFL